MPAAVPAKFSRAEFSAAVDKKTKRKRSLLSFLMVITAASAWGLGSFAIGARLMKLAEGSGWIEHAVGAGIFVFIMGPILVLLFYFERPNRTLGKCPNCRGKMLKGSNTKLILATGKCGWCGHEVLEYEDCLQPAIPAIRPSVEFKKLSLADFTTKSHMARNGNVRRDLTFTLLYVGGLAPFLWVFYAAASHGTYSPGRPFAALFVAWLLLSPVLWSKLSRWLFARDPFPSCPDCHGAWQFPWESLTIVATGRCGHCGVQVLEENEGAPSTARSRTGSDILHNVNQHAQRGEVQLLSRSKFMALFREEKDTTEAARPGNQNEAALALGSSLAILIGSILFLSGLPALIVPLGWFFAVIFISERRQKRQKVGGADAALGKCPFCENSNKSSTQFIITTGRCKKCLNVILQDDLGQEQKAIH